MFFTKSEPVGLREKEVRKTLSAEDGTALVLINVTYPEATGGNRDKFLQAAKPFYERSAMNFLAFAEGELLARAKKLYETALVTETEFKPLGAVMKYTKTFDSKKIISLYTDISIFSGDNQQTGRLRNAQTWNKQKGFLYAFTDFLGKGADDFLLEEFSAKPVSSILDDEQYHKQMRRYFSETSFYLTENAFVFYYPAERLGLECGIKTFHIEYEKLEAKKLLQISP